MVIKMTKNISEVHKKLLLEGLKMKRVMYEKGLVRVEIQEKVKKEILATEKDLKEIKNHLKIMKDVASLFRGND